MTTSSDRKKFFDLHITGLGYVNRIREVKPRKGNPFVACDISALYGPSDAVEYLRFDCKVSGAHAQHLIRKCKQACDANRKVLIGFRLGDPWIDIFTYSKGEKEGQTGASLKARLLFVSWIKIDGKLEYKADTKAQDEASREAAPESEPPASDAEADGSEPPTANGAASPAEAPAVAA